VPLDGHVRKAEALRHDTIGIPVEDRLLNFYSVRTSADGALPRHRPTVSGPTYRYKGHRNVTRSQRCDFRSNHDSSLRYSKKGRMMIQPLPFQAFERFIQSPTGRAYPVGLPFIHAKGQSPASRHPILS